MDELCEIWVRDDDFIKLNSSKHFDNSCKFSIITNFFHFYSNPTPPGIWNGNVIWEPIRSPNNFTYLNIKDTLQLRYKMPFAKRMAFWDNLYDHYGYKLS